VIYRLRTIKIMVLKMIKISIISLSKRLSTKRLRIIIHTSQLRRISWEEIYR